MYYGRSCARNGNEAGRSMETARNLPFRCTNGSGKLFNDLYRMLSNHTFLSFNRWHFLATRMIIPTRLSLVYTQVVQSCLFFPGSISDKQLTWKSRILDLLEPGDSLMADKAFILKLTHSPGCEIKHFSIF